MILPDYQVVVDLFVNLSIITFPIALVILIVEKITNIFIRFVFGKEVDL